MDNNFNDESDVAKYRATRNLNIEFENPQFNIDDTHDVNLNDNLAGTSEKFNNQHVDTAVTDIKIEGNYNNFQNNIVNDQNDIVNNTYDNNIDKEEIVVDTSLNDNNTFVNNGINVNNNINYDNIKYDDSTSIVGNDKATYAPVSKSKKKKVSLAIPKELLILFILVLIILTFIYIIPSLYEFFRGIRLSIVR